jgi:RNA polymerase sigma-70 factor (ECF subfamily)
METDVNTSKDKDLVIRLQDGDLEALGCLFDRHRQLVFRTALGITSDEEVAADLLQDVFLRLHRFADHIDVDRPLEPWLYRMTANLSYTYLKRRSRWWRALKEMTEWFTREKRTTPHMYAERNERWEKVSRAVTQLPVAQRIVIVLYYVNDLPLREISEILDIPTGTVKSRLFYGRKTLKRELGLEKGAIPEGHYELSTGT